MLTSENINSNNQTYNVQDELRRYNLKRYVKQVGTVLAKTKSDVFAEEGDPLLNYDIDGTNQIKRTDRQEEADPERYYKEQRQVVNINSRFRMDRILKPIEHKFLRDHPWATELLEKFWDPEEGTFKDIEKLIKVLNSYQSEKSECFALFRLDAQSPLRPGIFEKISSQPSDYTFQLPKGLNNIKTLRVLSTEIPGCLPSITQDNNLILIDLVKHCYCQPCTGDDSDSCDNSCDTSKYHSKDHSQDHFKDHSKYRSHSKYHSHEIEYAPDYLLPYIVVQIPPGNYGLEELAETMEDRINQSVFAYTCLGIKNLFEVQADPETDAFLITLKHSKECLPEHSKECLPEHSKECDHPICHNQPSTHIITESHPNTHGSPNGSHNGSPNGYPKSHKSPIGSLGSHKYKLKFRLRFCSHPQIEELSLWYMLGFPKASSPGLVESWSNLVPVACSKHFSKVVNQRPFRPVDLIPHKYIYLAIRGFGTINDPLVDSPDLFAKIELGPKPTDATGKTLYNTFICNPKIFLDTPLRLVDRLNISWLDAWGQLVDFHNQEHSMALEFVLYIDSLVDSNFSSLRGTRDQTSFTESSLRN